MWSSLFLLLQTLQHWSEKIEIDRQKRFLIDSLKSLNMRCQHKTISNSSEKSNNHECLKKTLLKLNRIISFFTAIMKERQKKEVNFSWTVAFESGYAQWTTTTKNRWNLTELLLSDACHCLSSFCNSASGSNSTQVTGYNFSSNVTAFTFHNKTSKKKQWLFQPGISSYNTDPDKLQQNFNTPHRAAFTHIYCTEIYMVYAYIHIYVYIYIYSNTTESR